MAFPNVNDIVATTIEARSGRIADNVTKNNALLSYLNRSGNTRPVSGGSKIFEEISFAENGNAQWYSGYDTLNVAPQDVVTAAEFKFAQAACAITISGLEQLMNSGREQIIDLLEARIKVAESTMANLISTGIYSDGTGAGGKQLDGLDAAVSDSPTTGVYGSIDRAVYTMWRNQYATTGAATPTAAQLQGAMNTMWGKLVRGADRPNLIVMGATFWGAYLATLQAAQRFTNPDSASLGFPTLKYMDSDVVLDGGMGGNAETSTAFFLNTKYLHWRPHRNRNMVSLTPRRRWSTNQDAETVVLAWAGNMTASGPQFQGRLKISA